MAMSRAKARLRSRMHSFLGQEEVAQRLNRQLRRIEELEREAARVAPQLAALEARVESLRETVERGFLPTPRVNGTVVADPEIRTVWEEMRRQQEQVRARISAAARFEERLRRVEDSLEQDGRL